MQSGEREEGPTAQKGRRENWREGMTGGKKEKAVDKGKVEDGSRQICERVRIREKRIL